MDYKALLREVFDCCYGHERTCPIHKGAGGQTTGGDAEALPGPPDSSIVFVGPNPNPLPGLTYPREYDAYWETLTTCLPRLYDLRVWDLPKKVLNVLAEVSGRRISLDKDVCICDAAHCVTTSSDPLKPYLKNIQANFPCSGVNAEFLTARSPLCRDEGDT